MKMLKKQQSYPDFMKMADEYLNPDSKKIYNRPTILPETVISLQHTSLLK